MTNGGIIKSKEMAKKRKLGSKNPKYLRGENEDLKVKKEVLLPIKKGVKMYAIWYENEI